MNTSTNVHVHNDTPIKVEVITDSEARPDGYLVLSFNQQVNVFLAPEDAARVVDVLTAAVRSTFPPGFPSKASGFPA